MTNIGKMTAEIFRVWNKNFSSWNQAVKAVQARQVLKYLAVFELTGEVIVAEGPCEISSAEVRAVISHIRQPGHGLTKINIDKMQFLCLGAPPSSLIAMSNFNMVDKPSIIQEVETRLEKIATRSVSLSSEPQWHALQMAASICDDVLLLGIGIYDECSCLEELQGLKFLHRKLAELDSWKRQEIRTSQLDP